MLRTIRAGLWLCAVTCTAAATADAWLHRWTGLLTAGLGVMLALAAVWLARMLGRQLARQDAQVHALAAECEMLRRDKRVLSGLAAWLSDGVTMPMQRLATRPQPALRVVRRRDR